MNYLDNSDNFLLTTNPEIADSIIKFLKTVYYAVSYWYKVHAGRYCYLWYKLHDKSEYKRRKSQLLRRNNEKCIKTYNYMKLDYPREYFLFRMIIKMIVTTFIWSIIIISIIICASRWTRQKQLEYQKAHYKPLPFTNEVIIKTTATNELLKILNESKKTNVLYEDPQSVIKSVTKKVSNHLSYNYSHYSLTKVHKSDTCIYIYIKSPYKQNNTRWIPNSSISETVLDKIGREISSIISTNLHICIRYYMDGTDEDDIYYTYTK